MAQASTAGTAILRYGRNEVGGIFLLKDSIRFQEMTPLLQIFSHSPSCSAPNKSPTHCKLQWSNECENGINQNKTGNQQSITGGSLINESQKAARTIWEINETLEKAKTTGKLQLSLGKKTKKPFVFVRSFDLRMSRHFTSNFFYSCLCYREINTDINATFPLRKQEQREKSKGFYNFPCN